MHSLIKLILLLLICSGTSCLEAQDFPPTGYKEAHISTTSPQESFRVVSFIIEPYDADAPHPWQVWIEVLKSSNIKTQLLYYGQPACCFISYDENYIALNIHVGSGFQDLRVFTREKDGVFHDKKKDFEGAIPDRVAKQFTLKTKLDLDHTYWGGDQWLRDGVLLAHVSGHHSGNEDFYGLKAWYFIYDVKNDRFTWDLTEINKDAFLQGKPKKISTTPTQ
jgi:hypothetical protein